VGDTFFAMPEDPEPENGVSPPWDVPLRKIMEESLKISLQLNCSGAEWKLTTSRTTETNVTLLSNKASSPPMRYRSAGSSPPEMRNVRLPGLWMHAVPLA